MGIKRGLNHKPNLIKWKPLNKNKLFKNFNDCQTIYLNIDIKKQLINKYNFYYLYYILKNKKQNACIINTQQSLKNRFN